MKYSLNIEVDGSPRLYIGKRLWRVEIDDSQYFQVSCPACDDKKKVVIRGVEYPCPRCTGSSRYSDNSANAIKIHRYIPREYIVYALEIKGPTVKNNYTKDGLNVLPDVRYSAFAKEGNGQWSISTKYVSEQNLYDPKRERDDCFYETIKDAASIAKKKNEAEKDDLTKFNKEHSTNHKYPFEEE